MLYISGKDYYEKNQSIIKDISESQIVIVNLFKETNCKPDDFYFIFGFNNLIIIINQSLQDFVNWIILKNPKILFCFISDTKNIFDQKINFNYPKETNNLYEKYFPAELSNFNQEICLIKSVNYSCKEIWNSILPCISGYFIKQSYLKLNFDRINEYNNNLNKSSNIKTIYEDDYIELRNNGSGYTSQTFLIYHIVDEQFYLLKKSNINLKEFSELLKRETENYLHIRHYLVPKFIGTVYKKDFLVIEFISGKTMNYLSDFNYSKIEKINIFFQLLLVFQYLHNNGFVYRDLKPTNVMINFNKTIVLIDFDRMLKISDVTNDYSHTKDFQSEFTDPNMNSGKVSYANDIYSLGMMIYYIFNEQNQINDANLLSFYKKCIDLNSEKRIPINNLISEFYSIFYSDIDNSFIFSMHQNDVVVVFKDGSYLSDGKFVSNNVNKSFHMLTKMADQNDKFAQSILAMLYFEGKHIKQDINEFIYYLTLAANQNLKQEQYRLGIIYYEGQYITRDINKSIHYLTLAAIQNYLEAHDMLGNIYYEGKYIKRDINKSIHYLTLAANQNHKQSQTLLGNIYYEGEYIKPDINKSIYYLTLAANQNYPQAQNNLGHIYQDGKYIKRDINKSIYYLTQAANKNISTAQYNLGLMHYNNRYIKQDINKSIYYFTLAANQNNPKAQAILGEIYYDGKYILIDINKAIYYLTLAANHNIPKAQAILGSIYYESKYKIQDIKKAIYYLTLAANQNYPEAQNNLGFIFYEGKYSKIDINKSIYYLTLAANQNIPASQYTLGDIYYENKYISRDINKSIYYLTLAANQNFPEAQYKLGIIYYEGKHITRDINKSIYYLTLAAKQNIPDAQNILGIIYYEGKYITRDINKSIYYLTLVANQNYPQALNNLGIIYYEGKHITRDINKSIYYLTLAAKQNIPEAQYSLGIIYYEGKYITRDINKSIHYLTLASNQSLANAQYNLSLIFNDDKDIRRDINKSIYYLTLAANLNYPAALNNLGVIYYEGKYIPQNINKSIYYLTLSANQNDESAQYNLGLYYLKNNYVNKGLNYLIQSSQNQHILAIFAMSFVYHEGKYIMQDINKAVNYYKEASSFNNQYAKNNLGIIYQNEFNNNLPNYAFSIELFKEAIIQKNDCLAMYNLSHIYLYNDYFIDIDKSIDFLLLSSKQNFNPSIELLCIALVKKYGNDIKIKLKEKIDKLTLNKIQFYVDYLLSDKLFFEKRYNYFKDTNFLYNCFRSAISTHEFGEKKSNGKTKCKNINSKFYEGFGIDLLKTLPN